MCGRWVWHWHWWGWSRTFVMDAACGRRNYT
nr:MAG TPA: hypothetical protein [Caudoviricetes sp.]DAX24333.1 MAG TPA: hypothetical protein [Caudoviricetes sp.]